MLERLRRSHWRFAFVWLYAMAMLTIGVAHRQAFASASHQANWTVLAVSNGVSPIICGADQDGKPTNEHARETCDACLLCAAQGLSVTPVGLPERAYTRGVAVPLVDGSVRQSGDWNAPRSRGPPAFVNV